MSEEQETVVEEAVVNPESSQEEEQSQAQQQEPEMSQKEINFQRLREAKENLERENQELRSKMNRSQEKPKQETDFDIDDDDLVEGKVVKRLYSEIANLRKTYEDERASTIPDRLKSKFSDFDQIVTPENLSRLQREEPELHAAIVSGGDLYKKDVTAYKILSRQGYAPKENYDTQKAQVKANASIPRSTQAVKGQGALAEANMFAQGLTPALKKQLQAEMEDAMKGV